jgi:sporulation protein YlmC with PRC-barrel domain
MRASDLQCKQVRDDHGRRLGRLDELHIRDGVVTTLVCGPVGLLQRFMASRAGRRVPWSDVIAVTPDAIIVTTRRSGAGSPKPKAP